MLEVKNVSVSYGHIDALHNVSITVPNGKIVSVIGANGAGKTSLVNTISGLVKMSTGEILFNGEPLPKASHKIVEKGVVQVPEGRKVFAGLSVQENLIMGSSQLKKPFKEKEAEIYQMFPILGKFMREVNFNVYDLIKDITAAAVSTETLGEAFESEEKFENPDGSPIVFDEDFFGNHRESSVHAGPFEKIEGGKIEL